MKKENNSPLENVKDEYEMLLQKQKIQQNKWIKNLRKRKISYDNDYR